MKFDPIVIELSSQPGQSYDSDMAVMRQLAPTLGVGAGNFLREAQWHGERVGKTQGVASSAHTISFAA